MSHSSRAQGSLVHQSPDVRQGPADETTCPRTPSAWTCTGCPEAIWTRAARGGRIARRGSEGARGRAGEGARGRASIWNAPGRWVSTRAGDPTFASPTSDLKRANVRSEEHTSELQSLRHLVCRLLLEK